MMLTEVIPEALPDATAVKGFFDSLTLQKVIPAAHLTAGGAGGNSSAPSAV